MKYLFVGDPHVAKSNLEESQRLIDWIVSYTPADARVVIAGDLYHDFGVVRVECEEFWHRNLPRLSRPIVLTGNHDMNSDGSSSALTVHMEQCDVIRAPTGIDGIGYMPFIRDNAKFIEAALALYQEDVRLIFCHAEFDQSQYENGFYAPHGIDASQLPADLKFISGHIHKQQDVANVWYPGTPRHLTRSDAGEHKGIWLIDTADRQGLYTRLYAPTPPTVCEPFVCITVTPETAGTLDKLKPSARLYVDLHGPKDFITKSLKKLPEGARTRTFDTSANTATAQTVKESDGVPIAFAKYLERYAVENSVNPATMEQIKARVYEQCPALKGSV
jgi:DNA repair exonuclease SbcCD nuclease subunit